MISRLYRFSRLGFILAALNLVISVSWIAIAFDNPWHQGPLMIMDFPACYLAIGLARVTGAIFPSHYLVISIISEISFIIVGAAWFFLIGFLAQKAFRKIKKEQTA